MGAPRFRVEDAAPRSGEVYVLVLAPAGAASPQLGRTLAVADLAPTVPEAATRLQPAWKTDVLRFERLDSHCGPAVTPAGQTPAGFVVGFHAPQVRRLHVYCWPLEGGDPFNIETAGGLGSEPTADGWHSVRLPRGNVDCAGAEDVYECEDGNNGGCDANAQCSERLVAAPECRCRYPYARQADGTCLLASQSYDPASRQLYWRLRHTDRMDYGWALADLRVCVFAGAAAGRHQRPLSHHQQHQRHEQH